MLGMARSHLYRPRVNSFEQNINIIKSITSDDLQEIANEIFNFDQLSQLIYESKSLLST
jgi:predicted Zn-dependent peptidase